MLTDEDIDVIGMKLEERGLNHSEIDTFFLEHYGKKGMRWGFRKAQRGDWKTRSAGQKTGLVFGGYAGAAAAQLFISKLILSKGGMKVLEKSPAITGIASITGLAVGAIAGARLTRNLLQKHGKKPMRDFEKSLKEKPSTDADVYAAQRALGMKTLSKDRKKYEKSYQKILKDVDANERAMGKR